MEALNRFFAKSNSAQVAKQRLQTLLAYDRLEIPPGVLALIKDDIVAAISQRVSVDCEHVNVNLLHEQNSSKLVVDIPLIANRGARAVRSAGRSNAR
jgi:cell division topological specificity factor MinE